MSFRVTSPCTPHGLMKVNGYTTEEASLGGVRMYDFLPVCVKDEKSMKL